MAVVCAAVLSVPIGGIVGAIGSSQGADTATTTTLKIGFLQKVDSMNPYIGVNDAAYVFYGLVYDALEVIDNKMQPTSDLALSAAPVPSTDPWMVANSAPYGSVWQYNLSHNVTWSDGELFTADDVVWNVNLNANNFDSMWAYQPYSYYMKYAEKIDDYTVRIHYFDKTTGNAIPCAYAYIISIPMLPRHMLGAMSAYNVGFTWPGTFEGANSIVGTGPFMGTPSIYSDWLAGDHVTLVKNPNYHWKLDKTTSTDAADRWEIKFDQLTLKFFDEPVAMSYALKNGEIDAAAFPPQAYRQLKADVDDGKLKNVTTFNGPKITQYWTEIGINANFAGPNPSRLDKTIRQAMAMSTNKSYIVENYYLNLADVGSTIIPPVNKFWHYNLTDAETYKFNLDQARSILAANGYIDINADGIREATATSPAVKEGLCSVNTPLTYEMMVRREYPEEKDIAFYLKDQWHAVGIDIQPLILDEVELNTRAYAYKYDTFIWYWSADIDPNYQLFTQTQAAWNGWNDDKWSNESYEQNYSLSVTTLNRYDRQQYVFNCQKVNYLDAHYILLAYPYQTWAWRDDHFTGWGDWSANPGRSIDNFWMGNPLYFDLKPLEKHTTPPPWPLIIGAIVAVGAVAGVAIMLKMRGGKKGEKVESESPLGD